MQGNYSVLSDVLGTIGWAVVFVLVGCSLDAVFPFVAGVVTACLF